MYVAKERSAGTAVYDPTQDQHSPDRLALLSELRTGLAAGRAVAGLPADLGPADLRCLRRRRGAAALGLAEARPRAAGGLRAPVRAQQPRPGPHPVRARRGDPAVPGLGGRGLGSTSR
jgi:hypothetical protein